MDHYTDGTTTRIEKFAGKTIKSFFFPDDDEPFDAIRIIFTDGSHLELCAEQLTATLAISSQVNANADQRKKNASQNFD